jgi:hypothetical protein
LTRHDSIVTLVNAICNDVEDGSQLAAALTVAAKPMGYPLESQVEALGTIGHWAEIAGDNRRIAKSVDKLQWQLIEGLLERAAHTVDKGIIGTMHQNNMAERHYSGR